MLQDAQKVYWYTAAEAAEQLSRNSGRTIQVSYVRQLDRLGRLTTWKIGKRTKLYKRIEIDNYTVMTTRGRRSSIRVS